MAKILIVDDDIKRLEQSYTSMMPHDNVEVFDTLADFYEKLDEDWDVILVDTMFRRQQGAALEDGIGYEAADTAARAKAETKSVVILISGDPRRTLPPTNSNRNVFGTDLSRNDPKNIVRIVSKALNRCCCVELVQGAPGKSNITHLSKAIHDLGSRFAALRLDLQRLQSYLQDGQEIPQAKIEEVVDAAFGQNGYLCDKYLPGGEVETLAGFVADCVSLVESASYDISQLTNALDAARRVSTDSTRIVEAMQAVLDELDKADRILRDAREMPDQT